MNAKRVRKRKQQKPFQRFRPKVNLTGFISIVGSVFAILWIVAQFYDLSLSRKPNLRITLIQNGKELGSTCTRTFLPQSIVKTAPLTLVVDEAQGPKIVSVFIETLLVQIQEAIFRAATDAIMVSPLHRDQVTRSVIERRKYLQYQSTTLDPHIDYTLQVGNGRSRTVLFRGENAVEYTTITGIRSGFVFAFPCETTTEIDEGKLTRIVIPLTIPVGNVVDCNDLASKSWRTLLDQSPIARTNFIPFLDYIGRTSDENISEVLAHAPLFAHASVFGPYVVEFRKIMFERLQKANIVLTVKLWDIHNNVYIFQSPLNIEIIPAGYSEEEWLKVAANSVRACKDMHQRVLDLGLSWPRFLEITEEVSRTLSK